MNGERRMSAERMIHSRVCPLCLSGNSTLIRDFPKTPLGDNLCQSREEANSQKLFPMRLSICDFCQHVYLLDVVNPDLTYKEYSFQTSRSPGLLNSMKTSKEFLEIALGRKPQTLLDIGANDGTWLRLFANEGCDVFGVEPSPVHVRNMEEDRLNCYEGYFEQQSVSQILNWLNGRSLDCITINNTFANIENLHSVFEILTKLASKETVISIVTGYHLEQFAAGMFDYVYHEHLSYFSVTDLMTLVRNYGFRDARVRTFPLKGGSLQFIFSKRESNASYLDEIMRREQYESWIIRDAKTYATKINKEIDNWISGVRLNVERLQNLRPYIVGYGYAHSSATLMYLSRIQEQIKYLVDDNKDRWGRFTPGAGLEITSPERLLFESEAVLILAWQHERRIADRLRAISPKVAFTNPMGTIFGNIAL